MLRWTVAAVLGAIALPAVAAPGRPLETIIVRQDFAYGICAGLCLDHELTARSDGTAMLRTRMITSRVWKVHRYRISASEFAAFRDALASLRPDGRRGPIGDCSDREDQLRIPGKPDFTIRWRGAGRSGELTSCYVDAVRHASAVGYRALRIDIVGGERLSAADAAEYYVRWGVEK